MTWYNGLMGLYGERRYLVTVTTNVMGRETFHVCARSSRHAVREARFFYDYVERIRLGKDEIEVKLVEGACQDGDVNGPGAPRDVKRSRGDDGGPIALCTGV